MGEGDLFAMVFKFRVNDDDVAKDGEEMGEFDAGVFVLVALLVFLRRSVCIFCTARALYNRFSL
jgi:hypothetical protein